ncbi:MAG: bifunctional oligoribonuclease/PAP phosphatase NrnA [Salinirussus sp.]
MARAVMGPLQAQAIIDALRDAVMADPLLVIGAAGGLLVLVGILGLILRRLWRSPGDRFRRTIAEYDELAVLMHPNPDPDAMACAMAVAELADAVDTQTTMQYPGEIRHQENRAFETVLDQDFQRVEDATDLAADDVVLVDHNTARGFRGAETLEPVAVVDHHPGGGVGTDFTDVRTDNGACASIFSQYFEQLEWEPTPPEDLGETDADATGVLSPTVATGLIYGIQSDTAHLTSGCSVDEFDAAAYLYAGIDEDRLDRIANPEVDAEVLDVKARAITERDVRNAFAVSDVGTVSNVDAIPQAADELLRLEGVTAVVVIGDRDGDLHVSGRSRDDRVHMGKTLSELVDGIPLSDAGGHARMGGGQISLDHLGTGRAGVESRADFRERLFAAMSGKV